MQDNPLEGLLRPAYELRSAAGYLLCAGTLVLAPEVFLMTPSMAATACVPLIALSAWRFRQGWRIFRYRRALRRQAPYEMSPEHIPRSTQGLFLGRGFKWDQRHTQRLHDLRLPENRRYLGERRAAPILSRFFALLRKRLLGQDMCAGFEDPRFDAEGDAALHGVGIHESNVWMNLGERVGHTLVLGTTRVGKTRLAELLISQDIHRGETLIVFDPKGDPDLLNRIRDETKRAGRSSDLYIFHLGYPEQSARYNPIGNFARITEVATRIAAQLPSEGQSAAFREFVWRFVNVMARALVALGRRPVYEEINRYAVDIEPLVVDYYQHWLDHEPAAAGWRTEVEATQIDKKTLNRGLQTRGSEAVRLIEYARRTRLYDPIAHALASTLNYERSYFDKLVASLLPLMEKLTTGKIAALLSPDYCDVADVRPIFDWMAVIEHRSIVYVGLDALADHEVAAAVGNSMFADLTSVAGALYKAAAPEAGTGNRSFGKISVHADEFNDVIGDEFIPLLNKAGGAGFQVTAYTQTWSDVEARVGSRAKAGQIGGNFNNLIMLRVKNAETAEILTRQLPEVSVASIRPSSSTSDTNDPTDFADFASRSEDLISVERRPMLMPADLVRLPKGHAFAMVAGGTLYKIRIPLLRDATDSTYEREPATVATTLTDSSKLAGGMRRSLEIPR